MVETDVALGLEQVLEPVTPDFTFQLLKAELRDSVSYFPFHTIKFDDGTFDQTWSKCDIGYKLDYAEVGKFWISAEGKHIQAYLEAETPVNTLQHVLLDQVLPYALTLRGEWVLHAGAVVVAAQAVVFLGTTGTGKSTLTASFCTAGYPLLADDSLRLQASGDAVSAIGSYPGLRLWSDSADAVAPAQHWTLVAHYSDKRRITPMREGLTFATSPVRIGSIYVLDRTQVPNDTVCIEPFAPNERFVQLLRHSFRLDITDRQRTQREFETLTQLAARIPIYRLRYPRRYDFLPQVRQAISDHLETT